ncbi:aspartyl protease family protein [Pedobacter sp. Leaf176]|uniref:aspartyl protease family protein n=1 Tax=Pedobacter sp. Leaf176 TaxID=1736286 RepID=UPI0006FED4AE|nr:aspartyl protease family protein [Pedobacter sp. Leaf176]KQR72057.1 hypothetical protein ASF92_01770 [Pedobacter sp. Leaf176]
MTKSLWLIFMALCLAKTIKAQNNAIDSLNFSTESGLLSIEGYLNGIKTNFAFDTGASMGVLNSKNINDSKVEIIGSIKINDSQKKTARIEQAKIDSLRIGSHSFLNITSVVTDMSFLYCNRFYLLGGDVINKLNWKFDFDKKIVYFSKMPFVPQNRMTQMPIKITANRHFSNLNIAGIEIDNVLIDFGFGGNCTMDIEAKTTKKIINKQLNERLYKSRSFSSGLNSNSIGKETTSFFVDSVVFGGLTFNNFKVNAMEQTHNKIGLFFLRKNFNQVILNNTELKYWLLPNHISPQKPTNFDAGFYFNDSRKIQVVALNCTANNSANVLRVGQEVNAINGRAAATFTDTCHFITWYAEQIKKQELLVEQLDGTKIILTKSTY